MKQSKRLADGHGFSFALETKKNLGQNFLADASIVAQIIARAEQHALIAQRNCLEIGPGSGALTRKLLEAGWTVCAIEKDARAVAGLQQSLGQEFKGRLQVIEADILRLDMHAFSHQHPAPSRLCVGNIPYYITSDILFWFLSQQSFFSAALLMVQKEVADRLASTAGHKNYGRLTVRAQLSCRIEHVLTAPAKAFVPPPKVDSAVIEMIPLKETLLAKEEVEEFGQFTAQLFSARRKMLRKTLQQAAAALFKKQLSAESVLKIEQFSQQMWSVHFNQRPEELSPDKLLGLFRLLRDLKE
jgi:16S rRNA (adenine1518-N6/adenine1519-N6)-dimethyltransferase